MTNGSDDVEYERARKQEIEDEKRRQQRIRERVPGRKATGRANTGDIDGMSSPGSSWKLVTGYIKSCIGSGQRRLGTCH